MLLAGAVLLATLVGLVMAGVSHVPWGKLLISWAATALTFGAARLFLMAPDVTQRAAEYGDGQVVYVEAEYGAVTVLAIVVLMLPVLWLMWRSSLGFFQALLLHWVGVAWWWSTLVSLPGPLQSPFIAQQLCVEDVVYGVACGASSYSIDGIGTVPSWFLMFGGMGWLFLVVVILTSRKAWR